MNEQPSSDAAPKDMDAGGADSSARTQSARDSQPSDLHAALSISRQYIKDFSFENPNAPGIYSAYRDDGPELKVSIDIEANANTFVYPVIMMTGRETQYFNSIVHA